MSELWVRKVRTFFKQFDYNCDGLISKKHIEDMADSYSDAEKVTDEQREEIRKTFTDCWRLWNKSSGTGDNGVVTLAIFMESMKQQRNDPEFKASYTRLVRHYFGVLDLNGDGYLQEEEFAKAFTEIGIQDVSFIPKAFESMDINRDGKVSLEEYSTAIIEYQKTRTVHTMQYLDHSFK